MAGCTDESLDPVRSYEASLSVAAAAPAQGQAQLGLVDAWRVQVSRPGEGVLAQSSGVIDPTQNTLTVRLSITLEAPCEVLDVLVELSSGGEVWFRFGAPQEICVGTGNGIESLQLSWVGPIMELSPGNLAFLLEGGQTSQTSTLTVTNTGGGAMAWAASADQGWIQLSPASGSLGAGQSTGVSVTVTEPGDQGGEYQGAITVVGANALNSPRSVPVALTYIRRPIIGLSSSVLAFETDESVNPEPQAFTITNEGGETLNWSAADGAEWLVLEPAAGALGPGESAEVVAAVDAASLTGGTYSASIEVTDPQASNSPQTLPVTLTVNPMPIIGLFSNSISFSMVSGDNPAARSVAIENLGSSPLNWTASVEGVPWLDVTPLSGTLTGGASENLILSVYGGNLDPGTYETVVTISDPAALNSPQTISVSLQVEANVRPSISSLGVDLVAVNDETCPLVYGELHGSRFRLSFNYTDQNGNLSVSGSSFTGRPVEVSTYDPELGTDTDNINADVDGNQFTGTASFDRCIVFDYLNGISLAVRLFDEGGLVSNSLSTFIPRPEGAWAPPKASNAPGGPGSDDLPVGPTGRAGGGSR